MSLIAPYRSCSLAFLHHYLFSRPPLESGRYAFHKRANGAQVTLVSEEERLLTTLTPEVDGVR